MWKDPIVEEIHAICEQLAAEHGNDLHKIVAHVKAVQQEYGNKLVSRPPRRPARMGAENGCVKASPFLNF